MADASRGKSIADAYRDQPDDTTASPTPASPGAAIADAYRTMPDEASPAIAPDPSQAGTQADTIPGPRAIDAVSTVAGLRNALKPEPGYMRLPGLASVLPFAWKETTPGSGQIDTSKPSLGDIRWDPGATATALGGNALLDFLEGTGQATSVGGPNAPLAGKVSPEATALMLGTYMGMRPRNALEFGPPEAMPPSAGDLRRAPLSPDFTANPLTPGARVEAAATPPIPNAPASQTGIPVKPPAPDVAGSGAGSGVGETPPVSPTSAPSARIVPIVTRAQAEAEADRILQHFAGDQTPVINSAPLASGAQPTLSQSIEGGHGGLAGLERGVRDVPEQTQYFVNRETANTTARNKAVGDVIGDSRATDITEAALNARTAPQETAIFDPSRTSPVDTSDAIATLDQIVQSGKGQRDAIKEPLMALRAKLIDKDGNMQTDPAQLRGIDQSIGDQISPLAAGKPNDGRAAAHELMAVRDVLRGNIEQGAPGYRDFLAQQAAERSAIDGQRFLQARNITDRQGNVNLGTLDSTIKAAERQQAMPGARLADGVTDEQLDRLRQLRADYQNDAKQRLGTSLGSPTVQKLGVSGSMGGLGHPLLTGAAGTGAAYLAGANPLLGMAVGGASYLLREQSAKGQRMVMDALRDKLLNPEKARSAFTPP